MSYLAGALSVVIVIRCIRVLSNMEFKNRMSHYLQWFGFGLSYCLLCIAALGAVVHIIEGAGNPGDWLWLCSSAGLIICDRRKRIFKGPPKVEAP